MFNFMSLGETVVKLLGHKVTNFIAHLFPLGTKLFKTNAGSFLVVVYPNVSYNINFIFKLYFFKF